MTLLIDALLVVATAALVVPSAVFFVECIVAMLPRGSGEPAAPRPDARAVVVVPAHDEEAVLENTLRCLLPEIGPRDSVLVVADNCSDDTAEIARRMDVDVLEREDPVHRGKGYALTYAFDHLATDPPDVVIIVDADCEVESGTLDRLTERALATDRPVQAEYVLRPPREPTPLARVSGLAFVVRNRVRPLGLHRLGLPCHLTGSGMGFAWRTLREAPPGRDNLVEDLQMGLDLAALGHPPLFCPDARVTSVLPQRDEDASGQRRRWEHGQLDTLLRHGPKMVVRGLLSLRLDLLALGLDLLVPPLALLVAVLGAATMVAAVWALLGASTDPLRLAAIAVGLVTTGVFAAWWRFGRDVLPPRHLAGVPLYVLWKIPLYAAFLFRRRQRGWQRTRRAGEDADAPADTDDEAR